MDLSEICRNIVVWFTAEHWLWSAWGFTAQGFFTARFVLQWWVSEKLGKSVIPLQFWYLSLTGGVMLVIYAFHLMKWPLILGFMPTPFIAWRNLQLIKKHRAAEAAAAALGTEILEENPELPDGEKRPNAPGLAQSVH